MPRLSKSRFIAGWQCPLRLWFSVHEPELASPPDEAMQAVFDRGHQVGELAQNRYPGGVLVEEGHREVRQARERTAALMADPDVPAIFEAAIEHEGVLTRVDALVRNGEAWDLVEVKSATRAKEHFQVDVAVQHWVLAEAGIPLAQSGLLLLNREYVYPGGVYDLDNMFRFEDLTPFCEEQREWVEEQVEVFQALAASQTPPQIEPGKQCHSPYECPFWAQCSRDLVGPENPIENLPGLQGGRYEALVKLGADSIEAIPEDFGLTANQERVRTATVTGRPWVDENLEPALEAMEWPLHFLDFEAAMTALPRYPGTRPFDAIPFQFSCHGQTYPDNDLYHREFLATDGSDPRRPLAEALLDAVGERGSILVYSGYEGRMIRELAEAMPDLGESLRTLEDRLVDLLKILRGHYYHPGFRGSYSIKQVLPVLAPDLSYEGLDLADGNAAANAWLGMVASEDPAERQRTEKALREYCRLDSLAMQRLRNALLVEAGRADG